MLGFSPLASAPLADDGVIYLLNGNDITTGQPTVGASSIAQDHALIPTGVTTGQPTVGQVGATQTHILTAAKHHNGPAGCRHAVAQPQRWACHPCGDGRAKRVYNRREQT